MTDSSIPKFFEKTHEEKLDIICNFSDLNDDELNHLKNATGGLNFEYANKMIENAIGTFSLPLGIATNFKINKYINKKLTSIEICSLSGNGLKCDLSEFYWLSFANLLLAVLWVMSGMSLRSYRKHKNNVPALK